MAVFLTCKFIHHWVQILWRDSVSVVAMEGGRTYLSTYCASGVHAYSGPMALEARVLPQGGRSRGMAGNSITARKTECRHSASDLWNGRCLASPTLANHTEPSHLFLPIFENQNGIPKTQMPGHLLTLHMLEVWGDR